MQTEMSFLELFFGASFIVQIVIIILFILAGTSWWFIFDKWLTLTRAKKDIFEFEDKFWNSKNTEKFFTDQNVDDIENLKNDNINDLKILLANKTTEMLHGKKEAQKSEKIAKETFSENSTGSNLPSIQIEKSLIKNNLNIIDLVIISKLESSKSEIRRLIKGNAIKINNEIINDEKMLIERNFFDNNYLKLSIGKKRHVKIELI